MHDNYPYSPPWWLPTAQLQTIYPYLFLGGKPVNYSRERIDTNDGDFIDFDWLDGPDDSPTVIIFHGLEGSSQSHYVTAMMRYLKTIEWRAVAPNFRGCSGSPNLLARAYHSGDFEDINFIIQKICQRRNGLVFAVGVSLGGNALLKWLSLNDTFKTKLIAASAGISVPFNLTITGDLLNKGTNKVYSWHFLKTLKRKCISKTELLASKLNMQKICTAKSLREFDDSYTAPIHGFIDTQDYWEKASTVNDLNKINDPLLIIHSENDPFLNKRYLPKKNNLPKNISCYYTKSGGHVGFTIGKFPGSLNWLPKTIISYFRKFL